MLSQHEYTNSACAIVVTYGPDELFAERLRRITEQFPRAIVVNNHYSSESTELVRRVASDNRADFVSLDANRGLGYALNCGIAHARQLDSKAVVLFDQDSLPSPDFLESLLATAGSLTSHKAILGANFVDANSGRTLAQSPIGAGTSWVPVATLTTSGMLLPLTAVDEVGTFCEALFVDLVDMEFGLRARQRGYDLVVTSAPLMSHEVGSKTRRRLLGREVWPAHHSATRRYYMARNTMVLLRMYGIQQPRWALNAVSALTRSMVLVQAFETDKREKWRSTFGGIWDSRELRGDICAAQRSSRSFP